MATPLVGRHVLENTRMGATGIRASASVHCYMLSVALVYLAACSAPPTALSALSIRDPSGGSV
jgi:hypothetical protein